MTCSPAQLVLPSLSCEKMGIQKTPDSINSSSTHSSINSSSIHSLNSISTHSINSSSTHSIEDILGNGTKDAISHENNVTAKCKCLTLSNTRIITNSKMRAAPSALTVAFINHQPEMQHIYKLHYFYNQLVCRSMKITCVQLSPVWKGTTAAFPDFGVHP